jgi:hypothetical protein
MGFAEAPTAHHSYSKSGVMAMTSNDRTQSYLFH